MPEIICDVVEQSTLSGLPFSGEDDSMNLFFRSCGEVIRQVCVPLTQDASHHQDYYLYNILYLSFYYSMFSVWDCGTTQIIQIQG